MYSFLLFAQQVQGRCWTFGSSWARTQFTSFFLKELYMWCCISWLLLASSVAGDSCDEDVALHMLQRAAKAFKPSKALPSGPCDAGLGRPAPGAPCMPCAEGTWSSDGSCVKCRAGTWSDQRGEQSSATCQDCPKGTWSSQVGATALQAGHGIQHESA